MPVGEAILGAFFSVLFDRLTSPELWQFVSKEGIQSKLKKLEKTLKMIDALLVDAEEKQLKQRTVQTWLDDLQDLAYDMEDMLDEFATEGLRPKLKAHDQASTSKVRNLIPAACFTACTPAAFKFNVSMESKIDAISSRLDELCEQRIGLGLQIITGGTSTPARNITPTTSVPTEPAIYGRDDDKAKVLEMVLRDEPSHVNFGVIPIVGMGGLGKTTLAREVFNDKAVEDFKPKAWACISDDFDVLRISKALLESITGSCDLKDLDAVQVKLKNALAGKKFLLVLDDVWSLDYSWWETLKSPFMAGAVGSKIILTTRDRDVALTMGRSEYELKLLTDEACWEIFKAHVAGNRVIDAGRNSKFSHVKVVERCRGLPLAARTLGGLLRSKQRDDEWVDILDSKIWDLSYSSD